MANAEKVAALAELTERFKDSTGAVLTEYRGLTVAQLAPGAAVQRAAATAALVSRAARRQARRARAGSCVEVAPWARCAGGSRCSGQSGVGGGACGGAGGGRGAAPPATTGEPPAGT